MTEQIINNSVTHLFVRCDVFGVLKELLEEWQQSIVLGIQIIE